MWYYGETQGGTYALNLDWLGLIVPVLLALAEGVRRGFTAAKRASSDHANDVDQVREKLIFGGIHSTLAAICTTAHRQVSWPVNSTWATFRGEPGDDPKAVVDRHFKSVPYFYESDIERLAELFVGYTDAGKLESLLAAHGKRRGWAMVVALLAWLYFAAVLLLDNFNFALFYGFCVGALMAFSLGWASAEWWVANQLSERFTLVARSVRQPGGGRTS